MRWLVVVFVVGCSSTVAIAPAAKSEQPTPRLATTFVVPGEAMEYRVHMRGIPVGTVQVAVGRAGWIDGRPSVIVRSRGSSGGLVSLFTELTWELKTTLDLTTGLPIDNIEESTLVWSGETEHDRDARTWSAGDDHHDMHSVACVLRGWRSQPGARGQFETRIGGARIEGIVWEAGREYLASAHTRAVRYQGIALEEYAFTIWISDDALRVPLAIHTDTKWGTILVQLVEYLPEPLQPAGREATATDK